MQLNVYVPKSKAAMLADLDRISRETGRQKNALVLEALEQFLAGYPRELGRYDMGKIKSWTRGELYEDRLRRQVRR